MPEGNVIRKERYRRLIALFESWMADESGYNEEAWAKLERALQRNPWPHECSFRGYCAFCATVIDVEHQHETCLSRQKFHETQ